MLKPTVNLEMLDFQLVFESTPEPSVLLDSKLVVVAANNAYLHVVGMPGEDIRGKKISSLLHEREAVSAECVANLMRSLECVRKTLKIDAVSLQGCIFLMPNNAYEEHAEHCWKAIQSPILRQDGRLKYVMHRLEYVQPSKKSSGDMQLVLDEAQGLAEFGVWEWRLAENRHIFSKGMYQILGLDESEGPVSYPQIRQYFQPESWSNLSAHMEVCSRQGLPYRCDAQISRPDGTRSWLLISGLAVRNGKGKIEGLYTLLHDITEQASLKNALDAHIECYQAVIESSVDGFLISDCEGKFVEVNDAYVRLSGYSRGELLNMRISDVDAKMSREEILKAMDRIAKAGSRHFETSHRRKNGSIWPVEITASYWPSNGLHFAFIRDISRRKKLQLEIEQRRNEMETLQRHQVAAQTAAAFAHELNQPLLAISSYCKASLMLLDSQQGPDLNKIRKAVAESERQALRAGNAIRAMINALTVENIPAVVFDLGDEVLNVLEMAKTEYNLHFRFVLNKDEQLPPVQANRVHLQKVLLNLLNNCIEATRQVDDEIPEIVVSLGVASDSNAALVSIQDDGPGFSQEVMEHLFEPFFTTKSDGIGLGLMISRALIELNGGQLWVDSHSGPGAIFHLTLPFAS